MNDKNQWRKTFFIIWIGQAISQFTSSILQFAIVWYLTDSTKSPLVLSIAMLAGFLPRALLGPFIGVFIDRYNKKTIMILSDLFIALASLIIVLASGFFTLSNSLIYLVLFLRSIGAAIHEPTLHAVTPEIVPRDELAKCAGYSQSLESISQILSPAIAASLYAIFSLNSIIFLDVIGASFAIIALFFIKIPKLKNINDKLSFKSVINEAKDGFSILKSKKGLMGLVLISTMYSLALMPISALFPLMSMDYFNGTSKHAGFVEFIFAMGLLFSSAVISKTGGTKNKMHSIALSFSLMTVNLFSTFLLSPNQFYLFVCIAFLMGVSGPFFWTMFRTILQQSFPSGYLGRVMALSSGITVIASPIGLAISGLFSEAFGAKNWFLIASFITFTALLIVYFNKNIWNAERYKLENTK